VSGWIAGIVLICAAASVISLLGEKYPAVRFLCLAVIAWTVLKPPLELLGDPGKIIAAAGIDSDQANINELYGTGSAVGLVDGTAARILEERLAFELSRRFGGAEFSVRVPEPGRAAVKLPEGVSVREADLVLSLMLGGWEVEYE